MVKEGRPLARLPAIARRRPARPWLSAASLITSFSPQPRHPGPNLAKEALAHKNERRSGRGRAWERRDRTGSTADDPTRAGKGLARARLMIAAVRGGFL